MPNIALGAGDTAVDGKKEIPALQEVFPYKGKRGINNKTVH